MSPIATSRRTAGYRQRGTAARPASVASAATPGIPPATVDERARCAARPPSPPRPGATGAGLAVVMEDGGLAAVRGGGGAAWRVLGVAAAWRVDGSRPPWVGWPPTGGVRLGPAAALRVALDCGLGGISRGGCGASRCGGGAKKHRGGMAVVSRRGGMASVCAGGATTECPGGNAEAGRATDAAAADADAAGDPAAAAAGCPPVGGGGPAEAGGTPGDAVAAGAAVRRLRRCFGGRLRSSGSQRAVHRPPRPPRGRRATGGEAPHEERPGTTAKATVSEFGAWAAAAIVRGQGRTSGGGGEGRG